MDADAIVIGLSGSTRNAAAASAIEGRLLAFCELERLTRVRGYLQRPRQVPQEAIDLVRRLAGRDDLAVASFVTAEDRMPVPPGAPCLRVDHHFGHAATAFLTSPFETAAILVCDQRTSAPMSVWVGQGDAISATDWTWNGPGPASLLTECCQVFGFPAHSEHKLEALARLGRGDQSDRVGRLFRCVDRTLSVEPDWHPRLHEWLQEAGSPWPVEHGAAVSSAVQHAIGAVLLAVARDIRRSLAIPHLCLGGGLFYNTFLNTLLAQSGLFEDVYVSPNPGNAGIAAGVALAAAQPVTSPGHHEPVSAFLGPEYDVEEVKATLDNCKLSYDLLPYDDVITTCVEALAAGRLIGWFHGRMEWGHRALGHRSILASPWAPYVLDNLNGYLKRRDRHRAYGLSVREEEATNHFNGPPHSYWMEHEYRPRDRDLFRHVLPPSAESLRVQTVDRTPSPFRDLHAAFAEATGAGVLVNTSFNGFSEPIVCSPRDAIRVFYGTGLDLLVLGRFVVRK